jgi:hypothetical protein
MCYLAKQKCKLLSRMMPELRPLESEFMKVKHPNKLRDSGCFIQAWMKFIDVAADSLLPVQYLVCSAL